MNYRLKTLAWNILAGTLVGIIVAMINNQTTVIYVVVGTVTGFLAWLAPILNQIKSTKSVKVFAYLSDEERRNNAELRILVGIAKEPLDLIPLVTKSQCQVSGYYYLAYVAKGKPLGSFEKAMEYLGAKGGANGKWYYKGITIQL